MLTGALGLVGFAILAPLEPLAWPLVIAAGIFLAVSVAESRGGFRDPNTLVLADAAVVFGALFVVRPFPGAEAAALALVMNTAVVFATERALRILLPAFAAMAAIAGIVNWVVRDPVAWSDEAMVASAVVAAIALAPVMFWMGAAIFRSVPAGDLIAATWSESGDFANVVTERSSEGIVVIDFDSNIRYANPAFASTFGFRREELVGRTMAIVMDGESYRRHHTAVQSAYASGRVIDRANLELVGRHRDGHPITVLVSVSELEGSGERLVLGAVRDVSEMVELRSRLQDLVAAKDDFIATVSHELRTPLTAVVAYSEMLRSRSDVDAVEQAEFIDLIADQSREVSYLIEDLLVAARLDAESVAVITKPTALRAEVLYSVGPWARQSSLEVDHASLDRMVLVDPGRLRQILRNLVSNAVKHGGERVGIRAEVGEPGMCHVIVRDDGPGVSPSREVAIFEAYEHSRDVEGQPFSMGLGLYVSRRLAELMGGTLAYRRREGMTEFVLGVPLAEDGRDLVDAAR